MLVLSQQVPSWECWPFLFYLFIYSYLWLKPFSKHRNKLFSVLIFLAQQNTPIHPWNISNLREGFSLSIKRDDLSGNNKVKTDQHIWHTLIKSTRSVVSKLMLKLNLFSPLQISPCKFSRLISIQFLKKISWERIWEHFPLDDHSMNSYHLFFQFMYWLLLGKNCCWSRMDLKG